MSLALKSGGPMKKRPCSALQYSVPCLREAGGSWVVPLCVCVCVCVCVPCCFGRAAFSFGSVICGGSLPVWSYYC